MKAKTQNQTMNQVHILSITKYQYQVPTAVKLRNYSLVLRWILFACAKGSHRYFKAFKHGDTMLTGYPGNYHSLLLLMLCCSHIYKHWDPKKAMLRLIFSVLEELLEVLSGNSDHGDTLPSGYRGTPGYTARVETLGEFCDRPGPGEG